MKATITFRLANQQDIAFLLLLRKRAMGQHLLDAGLDMTDEQHLVRINEFFEDSNIILCDGKAIGLLKLGVLPSSIHIRQFQLLPEFQRSGIGRKVLKLTKRRAARMNRSITLNVLLKNPAKLLYEREGFAVVNENTFEYQMCCPLSLCCEELAEYTR